MICFIISTLRAGGAERVISYLTNTFEETAIITLMPSHEHASYALKEHVKIFCLGDGLRSPFSHSSPFALLRAFWRVRQKIQELQPSVIVSFLDRVNIATLLLSRGLGIPVIVSERIDPHLHDIGAISRFLRKVTYRWAKHVVCQTESAASYFPYPVTIIPNPVPQALALKISYGVIKNVVSMGRLEPQKDHKTLLQALESFSDLHLTIYGEGFLRKELEYYQFLNLPGVIKNIDEALCKADLFVFPSLYEGFPNALCEAMRVGLPVIASDCSGNRDIVQHGINGLLFPIGDVIALRKQINYLIKNPGEAKKMGEAAKNIVEKYPLEKIREQWLKIL